MKRKISMKMFLLTNICLIIVIVFLTVLLLNGNREGKKNFTVSDTELLETENIIDLAYEDDISKLPLQNCDGENVTFSTEKNEIVLFLSVSCQACRTILESYQELDTIFNGENLGVSVIWCDGISEELMKKYNVKKETTYKLQKSVSVATSTPTIYIVDKEGKIQFVTDEISQMLTKLYDLQYEKEEIIRQMADNYLKEKYQSGEKPLLVYFAMDGCSDCEAANPIIEGEKIQDKYQVVTIYREKDKGKEIIDTYSLLKRVYEITWYPSFVILDKETKIIGETPLQELETLLL